MSIGYKQKFIVAIILNQEYVPIIGMMFFIGLFSVILNACIKELNSRPMV